MHHLIPHTQPYDCAVRGVGIHQCYHKALLLHYLDAVYPLQSHADVCWLIHIGVLPLRNSASVDGNEVVRAAMKVMK